MADHSFPVPDNTTTHNVALNDTVTLTFNEDEKLTVKSGGQYLKPELMSGNFPQGSFIGKYVAIKSHSKVEYSYDKGDKKTIAHTILIGD